MDDAQWRRVWEIFSTAVETPDRDAYLDSLGEDDDVLAEVRAMLDTSEQEPAAAVAPASRIGTRVGRYEIVALEGMGGMGEVYAARDLELDRMVALKFLPRSVDQDVLIREAKSASGLNHPNIITVHEVIRTGSEVAIAMELVEGTSLREYCGEAQPLERVRRWGSQMAQALAAAHERRIVHQDIKPENVMVREDGIVKVLDFGISGPTDSKSVGGSPRYMSPEQFDKTQASAASDVFALGIVLYELATGSHPFRRDSHLDTARAIANEAPRNPCEVSAEVPAWFGALVLRMLDKDPRRRPSAKEIAAALPAADSHRRAFSTRTLLMAGTAAAVLAGLVGWWAFSKGPAAAPEEVPFRLKPLTSFPGAKDFASFSPDGSAVVFAWNGGVEGAPRSIYVMGTEATEARPVTRSKVDDLSPAWSPDGSTIAFNRRASLRETETLLVPVGGGAERPVWRGGPGVAWWPDGKSLVVSRSSSPKEPGGLTLLTIATGEQRSLTSAPAGMGDGYPSCSPDGKWVGFLRNGEGLDVYVVPADGSAAPKQLTFDGRRKQGALAWTADSREIVYSMARQFGGAGLWRVAISGGKPAAPLAGLLQFAGNPSIAKRGNQLAYTESWIDSNIYRYEAGADGNFREAGKIVGSSREDHSPSTSPDGSRLVFVSNRTGQSELWTSRPDGSGQAQLTHLNEFAGSPSWSPDGKQIAFDVVGQHASIWVMDASGATAPRRLTTAAEERKPFWSPDGAWVYFTSALTGTRQIWRIRPDGKESTQITHGGADDAHLSSDGRTLYYRTAGPSPSLRQVGADGSGPEVPVPGTEAFQRIGRSWNVLANGIYFVSRDEGGQTSPVRFCEFATGKVRALNIALEVMLAGFLEMSPDGRSLLVVRTDQRANDLMLIHNFR